ncbi:MAG: hypothetical protein ACRCX8_10285 [Sarcina sp.]
MASYRFNAIGQELNVNRTTFEIGGSTLGKLKAIEHRFSRLEIKGVTAHIPPVPENHPSRSVGYGVWWMYKKSYDGINYTNVEAYDGYVSNSRKGGSTERAVWEKLDNTNLFNHVRANELMYFVFDLQQMVNDSSAGIDKVPGWVNARDKCYIELDYNLKVPNITNFKITTDGKVDNNLTVSWNCDIQDSFILYVNGTSFGGGTQKSVIVPKHLLKVGENTFYVAVKNTITENIYGFTGEFATGTSNTLKTTLTTLTPTISNVTISNDSNLIDNPTTISWQSTNQSKYNIYANKVLKASGTTLKEVVIPSYHFGVGENLIEIEIIKSGISGVADTEKKIVHQIRKTFGRITPTISGLVHNGGNNRDVQTTMSWTATNADYYDVYVNKKLLQAVEVKNCTFPQGTFVKGSNTIEIVAVKWIMQTQEEVTATATLTKSFIQNECEILGIEPSGINVNIDNANRLSFSTSNYCDRWEINLNSVPRWSGTDGRFVDTVGGTFIKGSNTITVTGYYSPPYNKQEVRVGTKTVNFNGYGKPSLISHDSSSVYNTALPTFRWAFGSSESDSQTGYEIKVLNATTGAIIEQKTVISTTGLHKMTTSLVNNTNYTVMVSIKNKFNLWSDWVAKPFRTSFNNLPIPEITLTVESGGIIVKVDAYSHASFKEVCILRDEGKGWIEIANRLYFRESIKDTTFTSHKPIRYKARYYDTSGGYSESTVKEATGKLLNYNLSNPKTNESIRLDFVSIDFDNVSNEVVKVFAGDNKPIVYDNGLNHIICTMEVEVDNDESLKVQDFINKNKILCYRDYRGKKFYAFVKVNGIKYEKRWQILSLSLTEIAYSEEHLYHGSMPDPSARGVYYV